MCWLGEAGSSLARAVRRLLTDAAGLVTGAEWVDRDGREHLQTADVVLCAANGIGSARLLLASPSPRHRHGLANSSGLVGRRLMLHPLCMATGLFDEQLEGWQAQSGGLIQCQQFAHSDPARGFLRGALWELVSAGGPMKAALAPGGEGVWGPSHHDNVRSRLGRTVSWGILCEDLPDEANCVELSPTLADSSGIPAPKVTYKVSRNTLDMMDWHLARATESLEEAGARTVELIRRLHNGHFMGTARMGDDPATSVVDRWCMAHDVPNLGIIDGSAFVTAGAANPTSTIAALALRAADGLVERRALVPRPSRSRIFGGFEDGPQADPPGLTAADRPGLAAVPVAAPVSFAAERRRRFERLADALIPACDGMPAASEVGVGGALLDRVLKVRPDLAGPLSQALDKAGDENPHAVLANLASIDRAGLRAVRYVAAGAYYLDPGVRDRLGYPGTVARPVRTLDFPEYLEEGLLDHLIPSPT